MSRRTDTGGDYFENLYWCAFLLWRAGDVLDVIPLWRAKNTDFDTAGGFDVQFLTGAGLDETIRYLQARTDTEARNALDCMRSAGMPGNSTTPQEWALWRAEYFQGGDIAQTRRQLRADTDNPEAIPISDESACRTFDRLAHPGHTSNADLGDRVNPDTDRRLIFSLEKGPREFRLPNDAGQSSAPERMVKRDRNRYGRCLRTLLHDPMTAALTHG